MKPVTDDVVHSLLQGIAAREKSGRRVRRPSRQSAKVIKFASAPEKKKVVALKATSHRTISGVFCYVSRLRGV